MATWLIIDVRTGDVTGTGSSNIGCRKQVDGLWGDGKWAAFGVDGSREGKIVKIRKGDSFAFQAVATSLHAKPDVLLCAPDDHPLAAGRLNEVPVPDEDPPPPRPETTTIGAPCADETCVFTGHFGPCPPRST